MTLFSTSLYRHRSETPLYKPPIIAAKNGKLSNTTTQSSV